MGFFFKGKPIDKGTMSQAKKQTKPVSLNENYPIPVDTNNGIQITSGTDWVTYLNNVLSKANTPGTDYFEFSDHLGKLEGQPLSEQQKYSIIYPTYQSQGMTPTKLVDSAAYYIDVLRKEKEGFDAEMESSKQEGVVKKQQEIAKEQAEIAELTKKIQEKTMNIQNLNSEVNQNANMLNIEDRAFQQAYSNKVAIMNDHITKIQTYLK